MECALAGTANRASPVEEPVLSEQQSLVITGYDEQEITVDDIEVAQFIYLLLHNEKIRDVIDTIGKKGVPLLGRFTEGRKWSWSG
jgi:hypothetical protein